MLAILLYHVGKPVRIETIVEHLWDDDRGIDDHRSSLYALASRIRGVLGQVGLNNALVRMPGMHAYRLDVDPEMVDFHRFRGMVEQAREIAGRGGYETAATMLRSAVELWQEEPLADLRSARSEHLRRYLDGTFLDANKLLAETQLRLGNHHWVLAQLEPFVQSYPLDETLAQQWIAALCAAGREDDARSHAATFRRRYRRTMREEPRIELPVAKPVPVPARAGGEPATGPRQLPQDINHFTGHTELLAELDTLIEPRGAGTNVIVLSGMPGVGKTSLSVHWGQLRRRHFPDGQLYLDASACGPTPPVEPEAALGRFLYALNVPADRMPVGYEQRRDRFNELVAGRRMLVVLDNIRDSGQARPLIPNSGTCVTLITSRTRLTDLTVREGVRNLTVEPLPDQQCLALLERVLGADRLRAEIEPTMALVRLSGGLPLALRLIGEHVAERPLASIADLVDGLARRVLDSAGGETDEATLRSAFALSYDALKPDAARLFRLLGLYPGPSVSPEAAAAIVGGAVQGTEQLLNALAKTHLVNHDIARRYRFHDLLRLYAHDRAQRDEPAEERESAMRRLADWYLLTAANAFAAVAPDQPPVPDLPPAEGVQPLIFGTDVDAMRWGEEERGNLVAVTRWAWDNGLYRHTWQLAGAIQEIFDRFGRQDDVLEVAELAVSAAELDGHENARAVTLNNLGAAYFAQHDYDRAAERFSTALALARRAGFVDLELAGSHNLASVHLKAGDAALAVQICGEVLSVCRSRSDLPGEAATLHRLADACRRLRRNDEALAHYEQALAIRERVGSLRGQGATQGAIAGLYLETGQPELAIDRCRRALDLHTRTRNQAATCDTLTTLADAYRSLGRPDEAIGYLKRAARLSEEIGDSYRRCRADTSLAEALAADGQTGAAYRVCDEALALATQLTDPEAQPLRERLIAVRTQVSG
jgi:tetratricopeptide (TPR) repeat protein/DNA-binding SARP family transcriptional activator